MNALSFILSLFAWNTAKKVLKWQNPLHGCLFAKSILQHRKCFERICASCGNVRVSTEFSTKDWGTSIFKSGIIDPHAHDIFLLCEKFLFTYQQIWSNIRPRICFQFSRLTALHNIRESEKIWFAVVKNWKNNINSMYETKKKKIRVISIF